MRLPKKTEFGDYATWVTFDVMASFQVRLIFTDDLSKSAKGRLHSSPETFGDGFVFNVKDEGRSYLFLKMDAPECSVAHESWHIVNRIMGWCGVVDLDNEVIAYHIDHMVEKVYEFKKAILRAKSLESSTKKEASDGHN